MGEVVYNMSRARKMLAAFLATAVATATGIVAIPPAWSVLGLPEIASRGFVREEAGKLAIQQAKDTNRLEQAQSSIKTEVNAARIDIGEMRQGQINSEKLRARGEIQRTTDEGYKQLLQQQIDSLDRENRLIESTLDRLRRQ